MKQALLLGGALALAFAAAPIAAKPAHAGGPHGKHAQGFGAGGCPPGLAKKNNGCLPPGQAKKLYNVGQRWPNSYGDRWGYEQIPNDWRRQYGLDPRDQYYYGDGYLYRVDPTTMLVEQVIRALIR